MGGQGWWALGWSFIASGLLTVSSIYDPMVRSYLQLASFLFPVLFAMPVFDLLSRPFNVSLAAGWMW